MKEHPPMDSVRIGHCIGYIAKVGYLSVIQTYSLAHLWLLSVSRALRTVPLSYRGFSMITRAWW